MPDAAATIRNALCELLFEHGLDAPAAEAVSLDLIRDYPMVRREGTRAAVLRLCEHGMAPGEARETAFELLAFELLGKVPYDRALAIVEERCGDRDSVGITLRAARLRRQVTQRVRIHEPRAIGARIVSFALKRLGTNR